MVSPSDQESTAARPAVGAGHLQIDEVAEAMKAGREKRPGRFAELPPHRVSGVDVT